MESSIFWYATSLLLQEIPKFYKSDEDLIITNEMYNGLEQLYPNKNNDDFLQIYSDLKDKFFVKGVIRTKNGIIL